MGFKEAKCKCVERIDVVHNRYSRIKSQSPRHLVRQPKVRAPQNLLPSCPSHIIAATA
jgi:hypothetical protein